jgi:transglutaminase/protease-like cytokinesis protein 3
LANSQQNVDPTTFDYSKADSIALNFPKKKYKSYVELVGPLTQNLETEHEKFRVLFRWITDNVSYSYGNRTSDADKVVKKNKAVCIGYSILLKEMCNSAGIECEVISGYSKTKTKDINRKLKDTDHAWNAVKLYGKWYLLDVTWASSYFEIDKRKHIKSYNELFYLTPPDIFIANHYPKDKNWQLIDQPISKKEFTKSPIYYTGFFENQLSDITPNKVHIKIKLKDTLEISFKSDSEIKNAIIELGNEQFVYTPRVFIKEGAYHIKQKFDKPGHFEFTLFLNDKAVALYRLEVSE